MMKILGVALLATFGASYVLAFLGGDMMFFFVFKWIRSDLRYWVKLDGALGWIGKFAVRIFVKTLTDFSSNVQLRHVNELGKE